MTAGVWIALIGVLIAFLGVAVPVALSIRKDAREQARQQAEATRQAVLDATTPIVADRDWWRSECSRRDDRIHQLEDELRRLGRPIPTAASADPADGGRHSD
jgi:hypothetical protein